MMKLLNKIAIFVFVVFLALGCGVGLRLIKKQLIDKKMVAIRVEVPYEFVDYELLSLVNFVGYLFEENNYTLKGVAYGGNMYPKNLDDAYVNVFVRGYAQGFDKRVCDDKFDIFLAHKLGDVYLEEFRNYDYYLGVYKEFVDLLSRQYKGKVASLPVGVGKNKLLEANYKYDVLYIYELGNDDFLRYIENNSSFEVYNGFEFAQLSEKEREEKLKSAKVVMYFVNGEDGVQYVPYVPYALLDIISYGRPVLVNANIVRGSVLEGMIATYDDLTTMPQKLNELLKQKDAYRENSAKRIRDFIIKQKYEADFFSKIL